MIRDRIEDHIMILITVLCAVVLIFIASIPSMHVETYTIEVTRTEITGDGDYMIFSQDAETGKSRTFTLNDSFWHGVWNTADMYAEIEPGGIYTVEATGWRIPILSAFPNIIRLEYAK